MSDTATGIGLALEEAEAVDRYCSLVMSLLAAYVGEYGCAIPIDSITPESLRWVLNLRTADQ